MSTDGPAGQPPGPSFRAARRGYDREQVDAYAAELETRVSALEGERNRLLAQLSSLGLEGSAGLRSELEAVAAEVGRILEAAQEAAEGMRTRAADDSARWREAAETDAFAVHQRAEADAVALRGDAWRTGTELLQQVRQAAERIRATAEQDAILTRAEGEQEAHRLTASARKEIADEARLSRLKSERMQEEARVSSEAVLAEARREAEAAQERVRALEHRRAELLSEVDGARTELARLQADLQERAVEPEAEPEAEPAPAPVAAAEEDVQPQWSPSWQGDEGTVRIVSRAEPSGDEVVDAEAMAAEVRAMRARREAAMTDGRAESPDAAADAIEPEEEPEQAEVAAAELELEPEMEPEPGLVPEPEPAEVVAVAAEPEFEPKGEPEPAEVVAVAAEPEFEPKGEPEREPEEVVAAPAEPERELEPEPEPDEVVAAEPEPGLEPEPEPAEVVAAAAEPEPVAGEPRGPDVAAAPAIDDLFSRLRAGGTAAPALDVEPVVAPGPEPVEPEPARPPLRSVQATAGPDPFELRERLLLPLTNRALRAAKRAIVDLQNVALEELRTSGGAWEPDTGSFGASLGPPLAELAAESRAAGALAAAELVGASEPPDVGQGPGQPARAVVDELLTGMRDVLRRAVETEAGPRQQSAAISRFFRVWRTDEAERRLRQAALAGYHGGLIAACAALGIAEVEGVANGTTCAACPASTGERWAPGDPPPDGTTTPPAHADCTCSVLPCSGSPVGAG